jgi:TPR repeat protein
MARNCCIAILVALLAVAALPAAADGLATDAALLQAGAAAADQGDTATAFAIFRRLAIEDVAEAQRRLGALIAAAPDAGKNDWQEAAYWYERAAGQGDGPAMIALAALWRDGKLGAIQELGKKVPWLGEAVRWLAAADKAGVPEAKPALQAVAEASPLGAALVARAEGDAAAARAALQPLAGHGLEATYWLGVMTEAGEGGPADPAGAARWYTAAANLGEPHAALALGRLYETGAPGVPADRDRAFRAYSAARARGLAAPAAAGIGRLDLERRNIKLPPGLPGALRAAQQGEPGLAVALLRPMAGQGDAEAQYWLAALIGEGRGGDRDEAIRWYRAAALQGDAESAYQLALLLTPGRGSDLRGRSLGDAAQMVRWLTRAAEAGHHDAAMALGGAYSDGTGVARDGAAADRWIQRARDIEAAPALLTRPACVEDPAAPALLPAFLACNRGDLGAVGAALLPLAASGDARAQAWLAYLLTGADGGGFDLMLRPNLQRAAGWYAKAAAQGLPSAMHDYAVLLAHGAGVPLDEAAAKQWADKAAAAGFKAAE